MGCSVVAGRSFDRSGMLFISSVFIMSFQGLRESLATPISSPSLLELVVRNVPALTKFSPPAEAVTRVCLRKGLGVISES